MPEDLTKRQHYVWRHYLEPWKLSEDDAGIWTLLKDYSKVAMISLMDVGQESYFYKMKKLENSTVALMKSMVNAAAPSIKPLMSDMLTSYLTYNAILEEVERNPQRVENDPYVAHAIKEIEINTYEHIEGKIELMGDDLLSCTSLADFEKLETEDKIQDTVLYMCVQYGRTKKMRLNQELGFKDEARFLPLVVRTSVEEPQLSCRC